MPPRHSQRPRAKAKAAFDTRERQQRDRPQVVVVGFGRMGGALARSLQHAGWSVEVFPRSGESVRRAVAYGLRIADQEAITSADLCILTVPDNAIEETTALLLPDLGPSTALVHCAGALTLDGFGEHPEVMKRPRGSFHPLVAISDATDSLEDHAVALASSDRPLLALLRRMAMDLSLTALEVPEENRSTYHAGAVMAAGGSVALLASAADAFEAAGIHRDDAIDALLLLMRSALMGVEVRGLSRGLTGPVARGDLLGVKRNIDGLPQNLTSLYRALALRGVALLGPTLPAETQRAMRELLEP